MASADNDRKTQEEILKTVQATKRRSRRVADSQEEILAEVRAAKRSANAAIIALTLLGLSYVLEKIAALISG